MHYVDVKGRAASIGDRVSFELAADARRPPEGRTTTAGDNPDHEATADHSKKRVRASPIIPDETPCARHVRPKETPSSLLCNKDARSSVDKARGGRRPRSMLTAAAISGRREPWGETPRVTEAQ